MVGVYDSLISVSSTLGQEKTPPRKWTREEKLALAGLLISAASVAITYFLTRNPPPETNPCALCAQKQANQ